MNDDLIDSLVGGGNHGRIIALNLQLLD